MPDTQKEPVNRQRRWVVVTRWPGAAAHFEGPYSFDRAVMEARNPKWDDRAVAVYELVRA